MTDPLDYTKEEIIPGPYKNFYVCRHCHWWCESLYDFDYPFCPKCGEKIGFDIPGRYVYRRVTKWWFFTSNELIGVEWKETKKVSTPQMRELG